MSTFKLPDLGEGLAEAEIVQWHVKPGDQVLVDQPMVSVETAKAVVEVPVPFSGTVTVLHGTAGDVIATGAPLIDLQPGTVPAATKNWGDTARSTDSGTVVGTLPVADEILDTTTLRPRADDQGRHVDGSGSTRGSAGHRGLRRTQALPMARTLAKRLAMDLSRIAGSGRNGVVTLDDVLHHAGIRVQPASKGQHGAEGPSPGAPPSRPAPGLGARAMDTSLTSVRARSAAASHGAAPEPLRGARRAMAQSMSLSRDQVSGSTVCDDADIHAWAGHGDYLPRLIRALAAACAAEPALNAWYDPAANARTLLRHIDLAVAVDTPDGLIVPVLRDVGNKTLAELRAAVAARKTAAHERSVSPEDLRDFSLMVSNFGTLAGRYGIPLVVPPAVAIIGAGKVRLDAVANGDRAGRPGNVGLDAVASAPAARADAMTSVATGVVAHWRMPLSLSFDHRCVTGGEACRFLAAVIADLEKPD